MRVRTPPRAPPPATLAGSCDLTMTAKHARRGSIPAHTRRARENQTEFRSTYAPAGYGQTTGYAQQAGPYSSPVVSTASDRLTIDDVVVRTVTLLAVTGISAFLAVLLVPQEF